MLCLGIESSCDETALALVKDGKFIDQVLATQVDKHALFGGVVPELASREHYRFIGPLYQELLNRNHIVQSDIDLVAVTRGPGLLGCLLVGLAFAKALCLNKKSRLIGVNHLHAHLLAAGLERELEFPSLGLLVSGGHTHIYHMKSPKQLEIMGRTLDDAAGEACDKFAKMLHLPYPGGAIIDKLAQNVKPEPKLFPRPYTNNDNLDFSFSGLKTSASTYFSKHPKLVEQGHNLALILKNQGQAAMLEQASTELRIVCASYLLAVAECLRLKLARALEQSNNIKSITVAGGVAANSFVRQEIGKLALKHNLPLILPSLSLCTDNASMIAYTGYLLASQGYYHPLDLPAIPRGQHIPDDYLSLE